MHRLPTRPTPTPLPSGGLRTVLRSFARTDDLGNPTPTRTGRIIVKDSTGSGQGSVYVRAGRVYAADLSGFTPAVALRLLSAGLLSEAQFTALQALPAAEVGPTAIAHGYVDEDAVEDIHRQLLLATITHLYQWKNATWRWEDGTTTTAFTISPLDAPLVVSAADERLGQWDALVRNYPAVTRGNATPQPGPDWSAKAGQDTTPEIAAILAYVDGAATVAQIAAVCGFSRFEIAARLAKAVIDGLLIVEEAGAPADSGSESWSNELDEARRAVEHAQAALAAAQARLAALEARSQ